MASSANAAFCAIVATALWTLAGYALCRQILPRVLAIGAAPILGWAVFNSIALLIFQIVGFSPSTVVGVAVFCVIASCISMIVRGPKNRTDAEATIPAWAYIGAVVLAVVPAVAIMPKIGMDSVQLADPIFDHSKAAIIDAMARLGLPPVNPFFGENGEPGRLVYYYLYFFSAAQFVVAFGVSGWEADIGLTWFSAFASLSLMMGIAVWLSKRSAAAIWVVLLAVATSLRVALSSIFGTDSLVSFLSFPTGFAGWMFQAAWVPQHLMSASCVLAAMLLLSHFAARQGIALIALFTLVVVAGFESSTYVGGVTFAIAALVAAPVLYLKIDRTHRLRFVVGLFAAAVLAIVLAALFLLDQIASVGARGVSAPVVIHHFEVLGDMFSPFVRRVLDLPAYWLVLLPIEFPATYVAGVVALAALMRFCVSVPERFAIIAFTSLAAAGLAASWLLISTLGDNNDLGLRAVLPAAMVLIAATAAGVVLQPRRAAIAVFAVGGLVLSLPDAAHMILYNFTGSASADGKLFAQTPEMWAAVRQHSGPQARIGNNPLFLRDMTPWPVNISWALLANRSSCFAGWELAIAYVPLTRERREAIQAQFARVFEGKGTAEDISDLATKYGCEIIVVTRQDMAWDNDPFASDTNYRLVETKEGRWKIYQRATDVAPVKQEEPR